MTGPREGEWTEPEEGECVICHNEGEGHEGVCVPHGQE